MTAKEYLRTHQKAMDYYDDISMIINDLYEMRHDKRMTESYYERILQQDIRFDKYEDEYNEWKNLGKEHGYAGLVKPEYKSNDGEIDKEYASNIREELIEVVKEDNSFGYLFNLLSKDKDNFITQQEIETAIREQDVEKVIDKETVTTKKIVKKRETTPFSNYLNCTNEMKPALLEYLRQSYAGKGGRGKLFAIMVCALEKAGLITYTDVSKLHCSLTEFFGDIGVKKGFEKYYTKSGIPSKTYYTNRLKHSEIDEHTDNINKKISELKSS